MGNYILAVARPSQTEEIYKLAVKAFNEGPEEGILVPEKMRGVVDSVVRSDHQLAVVCMVKGKAKGVILGHVDEHAYCEGLVASDLLTYVCKSLRGTNAAADLVKAYADWCNRIPNLTGSTLGVSKVGASTQYMVKLFEKNGYQRSGLTYIKQEFKDE